MIAQCSEEELHILLDKIGGILIEDEYYLLSNESKCNYEDIVINYLIEKSISYKEVSLNKLMESYSSGNIHIIVFNFIYLSYLINRNQFYNYYQVKEILMIKIMIFIIYYPLN